MNDQEYNAIRVKLSGMFPSLRQWFDGLDESSQKGIKERWRSILINCEKTAIEDAIGELAKQLDDPWPYDRDRERAAAIIADKAHSIARDKRERAKPTPEPIERRKSRQNGANEFSTITADIGALIAGDDRHDAECLEHRKAKGRCRKDCQVPRLVAREYCLRTEGQHEYGREPRFSCPLCHDTGIVTIVAPDLVDEIAARGTLGHSWGASTRCTCKLGEWKKWLGQFDDRRQVRLDLWNEQATVAGCVALCGGPVKREMAATIQLINEATTVERLEEIRERLKRDHGFANWQQEYQDQARAAFVRAKQRLERGNA